MCAFILPILFGSLAGSVMGILKKKYRCNGPLVCMIKNLGEERRGKKRTERKIAAWEEMENKNKKNAVMYLKT